MYATRNGGLHDQVTTVRRGKLPRPIFICCGSIGVILSILGGIILGVGHQRLRSSKDYTYILVGSVVLGFGVILAILAIFLSLSWATLSASDSQQFQDHSPDSQPYNDQSPASSQYGTVLE